MARLTQAQLDEEHRRIKALANKQNTRVGLMPPPATIGTGPGVPVGFAGGPQGQLIPERQLRSGLQSAVTPMASITPAMTNQQAAATATRVGTNIVTPMGVMSTPLNTNANYSAAGLSRPAELAQATQAVGATRGLQAAAGQGMTHEAQVARARQLEQDKINEQQGLASAERQTAKLTADVMGKVYPAQAAAKGGVDQEMVKRGLNPATGQSLMGAGRSETYNRGDDGVWRGDRTGDPAPAHVQKRLDDEEKVKANIEEARGLAPAAKPTGLMRFMGAEDNVYGFNPNTRKFKEFGSPGALAKDKQFLPLTPEQQKAYDEGNKGAKVGGGATQTTGSTLSGLSSVAPMQPAGNVYGGAKTDFGSEQEAVAAGLPPGTIVTIAGRRARIK